ncbi:MAG: DUF6541 family protein [Actinomycetes bacterium]
MTTVFACVGWLLIGWVPGFLVLSGVRGNVTLQRNAVSAPVIGYGLLMAFAVGAQWLGLPVDLRSTWIPAVLIGAAVCAFRILRGTTVSGLFWRFGDGPRWETLGSALIVLAAFGSWLHTTGWLLLVPPNDDGANHGFYASQIARLHAIAPSLVGVGNVASAAVPSGTPVALQHIAYYPFGMHLTAALIKELVGIPVASGLDIQLAVGAGILLPLGLLILVRRLFPVRMGIGLAAVAVALAFPAVPAYLVYWGGLPFVLGIALVASALDVWFGTNSDPNWRSTGVASGLAMIGLFTVHPSEFLTGLGLFVLLSPLLWWRQPKADALARLAAMAFGGALWLLFVMPQLSQLRSSSSALSAAAPLRPLALLTSLSKALFAFFSPPNTTTPPQTWGFPTGLRQDLYLVSASLLVAVLFVGLGVAVKSLAGRLLAFGALVVIAFTCAVGMHMQPFSHLSFVWYSRWDRVVLAELFFIVPFVALGLATVGAGCGRFLGSRAPRRLVAAAVSGCLALVILTPGMAEARQTADFAYSHASLVDSDSRKAFDWLALHVPSDQRVLNDFTDGSAWMWIIDGVPPLFPTKTSRIVGVTDERNYLQAHAANLSGNPKAQAIVDRWRVHFVFIGARLFPFRKPALDIPALLSSKDWQVVFHSGGVYVLERTSTK